jgi:indolepyruvate ferredoxin oxidoreductase alpha subunit
MGLPVIGKEFFPLTGELSVEAVRAGAEKAGLPVPSTAETSEVWPTSEVLKVPPRPPALCPGCPHRAAFYAIHKQKLLVMGDIGCYSIGTLPPFSSMDAIISMGASIGLAHGMDRAGTGDKVVAVIGDSTFFHAGLPALANLVYNQGASTVIILDNLTTAMTGTQGNPGTGLTLQGAQAPKIDIEAVIRALGVEDVRSVDALDVKAVDEAIKEAVKANDRPSVVIVRGPCVFIKEFQRKQVVEVDLETCNGCSLCFRVGCPAILKSDELDAKTKRPKAAIDPLLCVGCDVCLQVCPRKAIYRT